MKASHRCLLAGATVVTLTAGLERLVSDLYPSELRGVIESPAKCHEKPAGLHSGGWAGIPGPRDLDQDSFKPPLTAKQTGPFHLPPPRRKPGTMSGDVSSPASPAFAAEALRSSQPPAEIPFWKQSPPFFHPEGAWTESSAPPPRFREIPRPAGAQGAGPGTDEPLVLEFAGNQDFPAVLAADAPDPGSLQHPGSPAKQEAENRIAGDFVAAVTSGASPESASPDSAAATPVQGGVSEDQRWDAAVQEADDQFRALVGQEVYMRQSLAAALLKRQALKVQP